MQTPMLLAALASVVIASCYDGDTCTTTRGEKIRLACIDAPEMKTSPRLRPTSMQAATYDNTSAVESRDYLRQLVVGKKVSMRRITTDRYGRTVAELFVDGVNVGGKLVELGHAEIFWKYAGACPWIGQHEPHADTQRQKASSYLIPKALRQLLSTELLA